MAFPGVAIKKPGDPGFPIVTNPGAVLAYVEQFGVVAYPIGGPKLYEYPNNGDIGHTHNSLVKPEHKQFPGPIDDPADPAWRHFKPLGFSSGIINDYGFFSEQIERKCGKHFRFILERFFSDTNYTGNPALYTHLQNRLRHMHKPLPPCVDISKVDFQWHIENRDVDGNPTIAFPGIFVTISGQERTFAAVIGTDEENTKQYFLGHNGAKSKFVSVPYSDLGMLGGTPTIFKWSHDYVVFWDNSLVHGVCPYGSYLSQYITLTYPDPASPLYIQLRDPSEATQFVSDHMFVDIYKELHLTPIQAYAVGFLLGVCGYTWPSNKWAFHLTHMQAAKAMFQRSAEICYRPDGSKYVPGPTWRQLTRENSYPLSDQARAYCDLLPALPPDFRTIVDVDRLIRTCPAVLYRHHLCSYTKKRTSDGELPPLKKIK